MELRPHLFSPSGPMEDAGTGLLTSTRLWGLAIWFFFVSVISNIAPLYTHKREKPHGKRKADNGHGHTHEVHAHKIPFAMTWYSYIFPQTALTTATFKVAQAFEIRALNILGCVMTGLLIVLWFFVVTMMIRAIILKQILWPEKGEDREEGGFMRPRIAQKMTIDENDVEQQVVDGSIVTNTGRDEGGSRHRPWRADPET